MKTIFTFLIFFFVAKSILFGQSLLPQAVEKYRHRDWEEAIVDFETIISEEKEETKTKEKAKEYLVNCLFALGEKSFQTGFNEKALSYLEKAYNLAPENEEVKNLYFQVKEKTVPAMPVPKPAEKTLIVPKPPEESLPAPKPLIETLPTILPQEKSEPKVEAQVSEETVSAPIPKDTKKLGKKIIRVSQITPTEKENNLQWESLFQKISLIENKIDNLFGNYERQSKELTFKIERKDKIILKTLPLVFLVFFLIFVFLLRRTLPAVSALKSVRTNSAVITDPEKILSHWQNNPETKNFASIITALLNSPEKEVCEKGFEFLKKIISI